MVRFTIDEVIEKYKEKSEFYKGTTNVAYGLELEQIVEWLEELKVLKENERNCRDCAGCTNWKCDCANERAYAIDEFVEALRLKCLDSVYKEVSLYTVLKIAEQMKAGET